MVLLDGGHNQAGVMALADLLRSAGQKPIHGICGMISTKDYHTACQILGGVLDTVTCVDDFVQNAVPREELAACFASFFQAAAELKVPPELLDFKFRMMKRSGVQIIDSPITSNSDFLKDIPTSGIIENY